MRKTKLQIQWVSKQRYRQIECSVRGQYLFGTLLLLAMMRKKRISVIALLVLFVLIGVPVWTVSEMQQARRNHALIEAIKEHNDRACLEALKSGADPLVILDIDNANQRRHLRYLLVSTIR